jgi:hypothetical protein
MDPAQGTGSGMAENPIRTPCIPNVGCQGGTSENEAEKTLYPSGYANRGKTILWLWTQTPVQHPWGMCHPW